MNCIWSIRRPYNFILKFRKFSIEYHRYCFYDYVQVDNGGRMCGRKLPLDVMGNKAIQIIFRSDGSVHAAGFKIEISEWNRKGKTHSENNNLNLLI